MGHGKGQKPPLVFLTSNNAIGDALKRRCLHLYIPFPDAAREQHDFASACARVDDGLRANVVNFAQAVRDMDLKKPPAVSETIDWARTVVLLNMNVLEADFVSTRSMCCSSSNPILKAWKANCRA